MFEVTYTQYYNHNYIKNKISFNQNKMHMYIVIGHLVWYANTLTYNNNIIIKV